MQPRKPTAKRPITGFTTGSSSSTVMVRLPSGPRRQLGAPGEGRGREELQVDDSPSKTQSCIILGVHLLHLSFALRSFT